MERLIGSKWWLRFSFAYTMFIFMLLPIAPEIWLRVLPRLGPYVKGLFLAAGVGILIILVLTQDTVKRGKSLFILSSVGVLYVLVLRWLYTGTAPAQKAHLLIYGALSYAALNAVWLRSRPLWGVSVALAYAFFVGVIDECVQGILPTRYFSMSDLAGNWIGAFLGGLTWLAASKTSPIHRREASDLTGA